MQNKRYLNIALIAIVVIFIGSVVYYLIPRSYIKVSLAPQQSFVKIDNEKPRVVTNGDTLTVSPGKHSLVFFRDEFNSYIDSIDIKNGQTLDITAVLLDLTDNTRSLLNNDQSQKVIEKYTGLSMDEQAKIDELNYPILKILPIDNPYYRMYSCQSKQYPNDPMRIAVCISMDDTGFKNTAYSDVKAMGYDLNNYEVVID